MDAGNERARKKAHDNSDWELDFEFPKLPSDEDIEDTFHDVWVQANVAVEDLCQYLVGNRHSLFDKRTFVHRFRPGTSFFEPNHKDYLIIAALYQVFLKDFEMESFGTCSEPSSAAGHCVEDPDVRAVRSYLYYTSGRMSTDVDYMEWLRARVVKFCELFDINMAQVASVASHADGPTILHEVGGPYLLLHFTDVAVACWNLQTLAFAFREPVLRLNVGEGDEFQETLMVPVVDPEDEEELELEGLQDEATSALL